MNKWWKYALAASSVIAVTAVTVAFRCQHKKVTMPFNKVNAESHRTKLYVVCLTCGKEFDYDWNDMRVIGVLEQALRDVKRGIYGDGMGDSLPSGIPVGTGDVQQSKA